MADNAIEKPKRRVVKKAETVREMAAKNQQPAAAKKQGVLRLTFRYIGAPFRFIGRHLAKLGKFKIVRFIGRILLPRYFRNSWIELRQVTWPKRRESWQLTSAVIIFAVIFGVMVALEDYGLDKIFKQVLLK